MNLHRPNANDALQTKNRSRNVVPQSGICSRCVDGCKGNCDLFNAAFRSREMLYPAPFGDVTAGADKDYPVDYSHLNIMGYAQGASGIAADPDKATFLAVNTETSYGADEKVKMRIPMFTGALGSTEIARRNWNHFAVRHQPGVWRERLRYRSPAGSGQKQKGKKIPRHDQKGGILPPLSRRVRGYYRPDQCGGPSNGRGRVCHRKAGDRID